MIQEFGIRILRIKNEEVMAVPTTVRDRRGD
ncbi:hypothetical protein J0A69_12430 [Algoriphagus sp. YJ13C]|uniref:Uncharacterized protein n=1 Tax=Algoriphagus pacificus TaxID=2811234 RepID=A0ABS3CGL1_9BACT|nr:hypothetical protein [Algoriphagus pacificus]